MDIYCFKCEKVTKYTTLRKDGEKSNLHCSECGIYDWRNEELKDIEANFFGNERYASMKKAEKNG